MPFCGDISMSVYMLSLSQYYPMVSWAYLLTHEPGQCHPMTSLGTFDLTQAVSQNCTLVVCSLMFTLKSCLSAMLWLHGYMCSHSICVPVPTFGGMNMPFHMWTMSNHCLMEACTRMLTQKLYHCTPWQHLQVCSYMCCASTPPHVSGHESSYVSYILVCYMLA